VERAVKTRNLPMFMVDLAVPLTSSLSQGPAGVYLYRGRLAHVVQTGKDGRQAAVAQAEVIIDAACRTMHCWRGTVRWRGAADQNINAQTDAWRALESHAPELLAGRTVGYRAGSAQPWPDAKNLHGTLAELHSGDHAHPKHRPRCRACFARTDCPNRRPTAFSGHLPTA
jgi:glutamyl-tRNA reductase